MSTIGSSLPVAVSPAAPAAGSASQPLQTLPGIPGQITALTRAQAEAQLQVLIETYHRIAPIADPQTLAALAKEIGSAARVLGDTAATASIPSAPSAITPAQLHTGADPQDDGAKAVLGQAGTILETIRRRLALAESLAHHAQGAKDAFAAAQDVAAAINAFGGSITLNLLGPTSLAAVDLLA